MTGTVNRSFVYREPTQKHMYVSITTMDNTYFMMFRTQSVPLSVAPIAIIRPVHE